MNDTAVSRAAGAARGAADGCVVFMVADEHFGLPLANVEGIAAPPAVTAVPHAPPALLGAGNLAGQIIPIIDARRLLRPTAAIRAYGGHGDILRLRTAEGSVGLWVDRVEALTGIRSNTDVAVFERLDLDAFLDTALSPPSLAGPEFVPIEELDQPLSPELAFAGQAPTASQQTSVLLEAGGTAYAFDQDDVLELLEHVPSAPIPRAPESFLGVGMLRGSALAILRLSRLLDLPADILTDEQPGGFALIRMGERQVLLAVERVIGLGSGADCVPADMYSLVSAELSEIILGFSAAEKAAVVPVTTLPEGRAQYLSLTLGGQQFALPVSAVEQVIGATPLIPLPRAADDDELLSDTAGAIELRGQIIPVAAVRRRLGLPESEIQTPAAYLILRSNGGHSAVGVDRVGELISLLPETIAPPPGEPGLIAGVAVLGGHEPLSIIAPEHLWRTF